MADFKQGAAVTAGIVGGAIALRKIARLYKESGIIAVGNPPLTLGLYRTIGHGTELLVQVRATPPWTLYLWNVLRACWDRNDGVAMSEALTVAEAVRRLGARNRKAWAAEARRLLPSLMVGLATRPNDPFLLFLREWYLSSGAVIPEVSNALAHVNSTFAERSAREAALYRQRQAQYRQQNVRYEVPRESPQPQASTYNWVDSLMRQQQRNSDDMVRLYNRQTQVIRDNYGY